MNKKMTLITVTLLMAGSMAWAQSTDKSDTNPAGAGVVKIGNSVADVCECNASSAPLWPEDGYDHLLPSDSDNSAQRPSKTGSDAKGAK